MRKRKFKRGAKSPRQQRGGPPAMGSFDFEPMMPFLRERVSEHHPILKAAQDSDLAAFMAALHDVEDGQLNHDIAGELARISREAGP